MKKYTAKSTLLTLFSALMVFTTACSSGSTGSTAKPAEGAGGNETITVRMVHEEIPGSVQDQYAQKFKEVLEQKSNGKFKVEIYPVGQLGDATQQAELLQNGGVEFAITSPGTTGTLVPENQLFSLHFLFSEDMELNKKILNESKALNEELNKIYEEKNIKVLSYWTEGFMDWTSSKPVDTPEGFKGLKMRTMASPMIVAAYEAYGANPTPVPYMEVYSGLQLNMIEGQENPMFAIEEMKFYEVQKYLTLSHHCLYVTSTAVNPQFFDSLSPEDQQVVLDTVDALKDHSFDIQEKLNNERLEKIKAASDIQIVTLTDEQRAAFKEASQAARAKYVSLAGDRGDAILKQLEEEIAAIIKK
ncbi:DctP family TRAP transporter solute-binding subunit [Ammoniphilus sp. YIM 78166]|uniref:TRAP transporter substrate-binding protein n=1 Tax=Ammoniphilus sp. YIM 78166 TaxID=1644106 RepID=UPI00106FCB07|nr:DctP family TRAP transporter solute-binding subunit [Ammoniphilus sp. YIM 78166]